MGRHQFLDKMVAGLGGLYGNSMKFFSEGAQSLPLTTLVRSAAAEIEPPIGVGEYRARLEVGPRGTLAEGHPKPDAGSAEDSRAGAGEDTRTGRGSGQPDETERLQRAELETAYTVLQWAGPAAPTLIFHHGSGDVPYHHRLRTILGLPKKGSVAIGSVVKGSGGRDASGLAPRINLIATSSPYNHTKRDYYRAIRDLERFTILLAGSVALVEQLVVSLRNGAALATAAAGRQARLPKIVVAGISLGGWVTNLHHAHHDSADEYRPIFAGAALDRLFTESAYQRLTAARALRQPQRLREVLNFEAAFGARSNANVHALLARHDRYIELHRQGHIYRDEQLRVLDKGHITGAADNAALKAFLLEAFTTAKGAAAA
jgi:hypothetical protein